MATLEPDHLQIVCSPRLDDPTITVSDKPIVLWPPNRRFRAIISGFRSARVIYMTFSVYNTFGQEVARLVDTPQQAGRYEVQFDASHFSSGTYIYVMRAGEYSFSRKMLLLK